MNKLLPHHAKVLEALAQAERMEGEYCYLPFRTIGSWSGMTDRAEIRRICRHLTRRGLAQYGKGLWNVDGEVAGAGYRITEAGVAAVMPLIEEAA